MQDGLPTYRDAKKAFDRRYVIECLIETEGNVSKAARISGKDRKDFYDLLKRTDVDPNTYRGTPR
jgi:two-component system response regulator GlrR